MRGRRLDDLQDLIGTAGDVRSLRSRMLWSAGALAPGLLGTGTSPEAWRGLGLRVMRRDLGRVRGLLERVDGRHVVTVNEADHPRVQRFTIAHELGHVLLARVDRERAGLHPHAEERLCDLFASHALVPRVDLVQAIAGFDGDPLALLGLCARYDVGLSVLLRAAAEELAGHDVVAFATSRRGHRHRPGELAQRLHAVVWPPFFVPDEARLASAGLVQLEARLEAGEVAPAGAEEHVELPLWQPGGMRRSGVAAGPATWRARRLPNGMAVVCLCTEALTLSWNPARRLRIAA